MLEQGFGEGERRGGGVGGAEGIEEVFEGLGGEGMGGVVVDEKDSGGEGALEVEAVVGEGGEVEDEGVGEGGGGEVGGGG